MNASTNCKLVITQGPSIGQEYPIDRDQTLIGRDPTMDIVLNDEVVSRRHAKISRQGDYFVIEDLGSSNGTFLNGQRLENVKSVNSGDRIKLGHAVELTFEDPTQVPDATYLNQATRLELDRTVLEDPLTGSESFEGPRLIVEISETDSKTFELNKERLTLGRAVDNDLVIPSQIVSRQHAYFERDADGDYWLVILPSASNSIILNDQAVGDRVKLQDGDQFFVESIYPDLSVTFTYQSFPTDTVSSKSPQFLSTTPLPASSPADRVFDKTMLDQDFEEKIPSIPPQLIVTIAGSPSQIHALTGREISIGRAEENDIVVTSQIVSRRHARLERSGDGYQISILPDVTNTLVCQGEVVTEKRRLRHGDVLRIDSSIPGMMVSMTYQSPAEAAAARGSQTIDFGEKEKLTIGRDPTNDIFLNTPTISRFHAQLERVGRRYRVVDLRSANGTFVNDVRVEGEAWIEVDDTIRIGPYRFVMGENSFTQYDESSGMRVEAVGLNKWVRKDLNILKEISLVFQPREFIVVVGQSGGGKSTLVDSIAGYRQATHGEVRVNGVNVYRNFDAIRNEIGFVPQRDIIHMELTVYQALDYAARLRMPRDTNRAERHARIMEVLEDLDLLHRKDVQISGLSGGQQKRVSIGVELLTQPGLFFLDEPTSGLDPGTETAFMHLMRRLADQGRTIVLVTHATKNVMLADKVVFLARGGYLAWFGPPDEALKYFDAYRSERERRTKDMEFDQIYAILDDPEKGTAQDWAQRFQEHAAYNKYILQPLQLQNQQLPLQSSVKETKKPVATQTSSRRQISSLRQFFILSQRNIKILTRDRSSLILMLVAAPMVGMLDLVIAPLMGKAPFDYFTGDASNGAITLFLMTIYCLLVGGLSQMREIVKEADIYRRERLVNLKILPYVSSKVWVAMLLALYHAAAYAIIHFVAFDMPGGTAEFAFTYVTLVLAVLAGMIGGLLASALAPAASSAPMIMILLIVPQIVLSGALAPVPSSISSVASTRWAFEGFIGITGIGSDVAADPCWQLSEELRDAMTLEDKQANNCRCMGVNVFNPEVCNFPGVGQYFVAEIDQPEPIEPLALAEKPAEPVIPAAPEPPSDQSDNVAVAQYLNALQSYQDEVQRIQDDYKNQMELYETQSKVYQAEMTSYQEAYTKWSTARNSATRSAEGLIESVTEEFGWAWVNKEDPQVFRSWLIRAWSAQLLLIFFYFLGILFLMKRKDVR